MGESGCVSWMFLHKGQFVFDRDKTDEDQLMDIALEAGAEDVIDHADEGFIEVTCDIAEFGDVQKAIEVAELEPQVAEITWIPENTIEVAGEAAEKLLALIERLEDLDDVQNVYANYDISDAEMERIND
jgi:transcriptional/translational regulatory protein YebC/TACO1